eukprot:8065154-Pyramimonas_sp.AAC.2
MDLPNRGEGIFEQVLRGEPAPRMRSDDTHAGPHRSERLTDLCRSAPRARNQASTCLFSRIARLQSDW